MQGGPYNSIHYIHSFKFDMASSIRTVDQIVELYILQIKILDDGYCFAAHPVEKGETNQTPSLPLLDRYHTNLTLGKEPQHDSNKHVLRQPPK